MAANDTLGLNQVFQIYHEDGTEYEGLVMHKSATDSVVMSLGDSISGDVYWRNNELQLTMKEYITYNGVNYVLVNPPTIVREGMVADNSELKGMTKYSFKFYHPMYQLGNFPFSDVAVTDDQKKYLSENKTFSWIGTANDFLAKLNKNLQDTEWIVEMSSNFPNDKKTEMSDVIAFDKNTVADALKTAYDTWGVPYVIDVTTGNETGYTSTKHFKVVWGLPSNEIYESAAKKQLNEPYIFKMGKGVGLKNNSRTPRNNKIITRIAGYGSENNIPYGYPQIIWTGNQSWNYTVNNNSSAANSYPIYDGIVGGQKVRLIKHPFTRTHLMPNVYVNAVNKKVNPYATGYNPDIELKDYYDATAGEDYPNPINLNAPSYDIHEFDDIKPELGQESIVAVTPLNPDLTPASSWDDTMDDDGNYVQSYFQITLPTLSFDIYACAAITEAMEINMRSGACLGCTFPVEVDWEDYKANFYKENGDFDPVIHTAEGDGHVRNGKKYPDSSNSSTPVKLILKKENATFGTLMPNIYQHPASGDQFVVLGISLPTSYITNAQTRLDNAMKSYMLENNVYYYDYPLKFDEAFLRKNTYILQQIKPNSIIRFKFAGENLSLYVKQMNVKFGEGVLPKYDITLTDNVDVVLNQIGKVSDDVDKLTTLISLLRQSYGNNVWAELSKKLSKTDDDTAQGLIRFVKGLQVGERFVTGLLGEGGVFNKDADGKTYIEADKLYIRMKAYFDTVEIRKYMHSAGNRIASHAGIKCIRVDNMAWYAAENKYVPVDNSGTYRKKDINGDKYVVATGLSIVRYRCYFRGNDDDGNNITNDFVIGDQAYCHVTNGATASLQNHHYWRLVVGKDSQLTEDGEHWIDLSNVLSFTIGGVAYSGRQDGSDKPAAQDDIVQLGNVNDPTRRGAIIEYVSGNDAPSYQIYQDIGTPAGQTQYSLDNKNYIGIGYKSTTGRAYMNVYGDFYFGSKNESTYIKYNSGAYNPSTNPDGGKLKIKAVIEASSTIGGTETTTTIGDILSDIDDLQRQIDGAIETWFYDYMPVEKTQSGAPANRIPLTTITIDGQTVPCEPYYSWYTADHAGTAQEVRTERTRHLGDMFYDNSTGYAFRFSLNENTNAFEWVEITDSAVIEALRKAAEAFNLADTKNKVFTTAVNTLPPVPYKTGDLWVNATGTFTYTEGGQQVSVTYSNDILKCVQSRDENASGSRSITDWVLASKYTDDTLVEHYTNLLTGVESPQQGATNKELALAAENAIRSALGGKTIIDGGLMLTSLIGLRQLNPNGNPDIASDYTTWAGISGEYIDRVTPDTQDPTVPYALGHGIAAWYGGNMLDKEMLSTAQIADGWDGSTYHLRWARSIDRFDGSGYRADGNISWTASGSLTLKNVTWGDDDIRNFFSSFAVSVVNDQLRITPKGDFTMLNVIGDIVIGGHLTYNEQTHTANIVGGSPVASQTWVRNNYVEKTFFARLFQAYKSDGVTPIAPNEANDTDKIVGGIKALVGMWTDQYLSALGLNSQSSGGGGVGDVTWELLASDSDTHQIAASHLNVLSGYATQSWVTSQISGKVSRVDVGITQYSPSGGVVSLPAYPTTLPVVSSFNFLVSRLQYLQVNNNEGASIEVNDAPSSYWWHIIRTVRADENKYYTDIAIPFTDYTKGIHYKVINNGTLVNNGWVRLLDTINYTDYTVSKTGGGASGTWGISISGTAADSYKLEGYGISRMVFDIGGYFGSNDKIYDIGSKKVFSGNNMPDAPVTGWVSGIVLGSNWNDSHYQNYLVESGNGRWYTTRHYTNGSMDEWKTFAYLTDNVASATKLQTARTLWGQSFDGTANVTGAMSSVTNIDGVLYFYFGTTSYRVGIGTNEPEEKLHVVGNSRLMGNITMQGAISGLTNIDGLLYFDSAKVGIGVSSPDSKLHVSGNVTANNFIAGTANGSYIQIGAIRIEYEYSTQSLKVYHTTSGTNANLYATGAVSALGSNSQSGGGGVGDVTWELLASDSDTHQIAASHLNVLNGYAQQSWVTSQGYLTSSALSSYVTTNTAQDITAKKTFTVQQAFTVASGSPFTVESSTVVTNLNADKLDGQDGSYYATASGLSTANTNIFTLQGYFTSGVANSATKLSDTTAKTAWGQTFFTGGTPTSISNAPLSGVTNIDSLLHFDTTNSRIGIGIGVSSPSYALDVSGTIRVGTAANLIAEHSTTSRYMELSSAGNEILISGAGSSSLTMHVNYRTSLQTSKYVPVEWQWHNGSSDSWSKFTLGSLEAKTSIKIGGATLTWVSGQGLKCDENFYSEKAISALGSNSQSGGGGVGDVTWDSLATTATDGRTIHYSYIDDAVSSYGYISQLSADNRYIKLNGSASITGDLIPASTALNLWLGSSSYHWTEGHIDNIYMDAIQNNSKIQIKGSASTLTINATSINNPAATIQIQGNGGRVTIGNVSAKYYIDSYFFLTIGDNGSSRSLWCEGDIYCHGSEVDYSDIRLKNVISYIDDEAFSVNDVADAPIFNFVWKNKKNDRIRVGTSAQYWHGKLPLVVSDDGDGNLGMSYAQAALVSVVTTARKVLTHDEEIALLKNKIKELENEVEQLKKKE